MKKYKILKDRSDTLYDGTKVYQIQALKDFGNVKKGDLGGWIEKESNLSQDGDCWVYHDAMIRDNAVVLDNAMVRDTAVVCDDTIVRDNAVVRNSSIVKDNAVVKDNALISNYAMIRDNAVVCDTATVRNDSLIFDNDIVTRDTLYIDNVYRLTLTDNHIHYGCIKKTIQEWEEWLSDDTEIIKTPRNTDKFKIIEKTLRYAIEYHELR